MSKPIFWGLTGADFENSLWNTLYENTTFCTGLAVAGIANTIAQILINNESGRKERRDDSYAKPIICTMVTTAIGAGASLYVANRLPHVTFVAEKAFKFLVITILGSPTAIIPFITAGGVSGYFGRVPLYFAGCVGAAAGGVGSN